MALSLEQEDGALTIMQRQPHGYHSNQGSVAANIEAWRLEEGGPMSRSARSSYLRWCLNSRANALLQAQASASQRPITAVLLSSNSNNTNDEVHITVHDDDIESWIENPPARAHINTSQSSFYASSSPDSDSEVVEPLLNRPRLTEAFLVIAVQVALTTVGSKTTTSGSSSSSPSANLLLEFAMACNVVGFLFCLNGILLSGSKPGVGARILTGIGYAATVFGVLAVMCLQLHEHLRLWVIAVTYVASLPSLAAAFVKKTDYPHLFFR